MNLICVNPAHVHEVWPFVQSSIYEAIKRGGITPFKQIVDDVASGRSLLWLVVEDKKFTAAIVTELHETEWSRACVIVACGGSGLDRWLPLIAGLEKYARNEGCSVVRIIGRRGWERVLDGYDLKNVILEKELDNGRQHHTKH